MRLYLVRHAWAEEADSKRWPNDGERPLTDDGKKRFRKTVEALVERGFAPRVVAGSSAGAPCTWERKPSSAYFSARVIPDFAS